MKELSLKTTLGISKVRTASYKSNKQCQSTKERKSTKFICEDNLTLMPEFEIEDIKQIHTPILLITRGITILFY